MATTESSKGLAAIVGMNIRSARETAGLTQHALAIKVGSKISNQTISDWERGVNRPSDSNLLRLATVLGHDFAWFFADHDRAAA